MTDTTYHDENGEFIDHRYPVRGTTTIVGGKLDGHKANIISRPQKGTGHVACQVMHPTIKNRGYIVITTDGAHALD